MFWGGNKQLTGSVDRIDWKYSIRLILLIKMSTLLLLVKPICVTHFRSFVNRFGHNHSKFPPIQPFSAAYPSLGHNLRRDAQTSPATSSSNLSISRSLLLSLMNKTSSYLNSSTSWRSLLSEANKTTSSAKSRHRILRPLNSTTSTPWLRLQILSIKILTRIVTKGRPSWH